MSEKVIALYFPRVMIALKAFIINITSDGRFMPVELTDSGTALRGYAPTWHAEAALSRLCVNHSALHNES